MSGPWFEFDDPCECWSVKAQVENLGGNSEGGSRQALVCLGCGITRRFLDDMPAKRRPARAAVKADWKPPED